MLLADILDARSDELIAAAMERIQARVPTYRDADPALLEDVRRHVAEHHALICTVLRRDAPPQPRELEFVARHAALRARRGVPLADFMEAFRAYNAVLWDALEDGGEALGAARAASLYIDLAATTASGAYLESEQLLAAGRDQVRRDLLEDLLEGTPPASAASLAVARDCGLEADSRCLLVAALPVTAPEDERDLHGAATALGNAAGGRTAVLAVVRHGEIVVVRAVGATERPSLADALRRVKGLNIGVSTVQDNLAGIPDAYREASLAAGRVSGGGVLSLADLTPFEFLTLRSSAVARRLTDPVLAEFVREDRAKGGMLIKTLEAYVAADLNVKATAEALLVHVNTAHHRLGRIEEKTRRDLRHVMDIVDLLIAIRLP
ncbi:helix-turn-helix domain-containing protein [Solirubrobacter ginsenosidimutans]|uniref:Helix-turn-helix domain-containing protein n=1 Tax=Solirubrobacter ginsenosidimutans TaxID=490573 RepID=A0A9X3S0V0_9ACTN|nr:helix-turn-helix domain-containing protein [Solirubrobacter ginsenosidimutans]MDA0161699.1 helix-turn-helix domain-containing protein [Solirubrobacter ginsenosidimutans]